MFLSSHNDVILIALVLLLQTATSQRLQEKIDKLPECSNNCISSAATTAGCAADDFACQCQKSDSLLEEIVGNVLGSVASQNQCLAKDCGAVDAASAQILFRQICGLVKGTTTSSTLAAPTESTTAPTENKPPPTPVNEPSSEPTVDFTAPLADSTPTEQAPLPVQSTSSTQPIIESSTTSTSLIVQSTPIPAFTLPPHTTLQTSTSVPPPPPPPSSTSSVVVSSSTSSSTSKSVTSIPQSPAPAMQASLATQISSSTSRLTLTPTTSSAQGSLFPSSQSSPSETRLPPSTTPTMPSYQAEANQSDTPTPQKMNTNGDANTPTSTSHMSPTVITAIVLGVLAFVVLTTCVSILFRRRSQAMKRKRAAMSTMTAVSRRSGEEITVYLDLGGGGGFGGVGNRDTNDSGRGVSNANGFKFGGGSGTGGRTKSIPLDAGGQPTVPMVEKERVFNFNFDVRRALSSHSGKP